MAGEAFVTVNGKPVAEKDPDAILDYSWNWTDWLNLVSPPDTIVGHTILLADTVSANVEISTVAGGVVTALISGGAAGEKVAVTCRIDTAGGRRDDRTFYLKIKHK